MGISMSIDRKPGQILSIWSSKKLILNEFDSISNGETIKPASELAQDLKLKMLRLKGEFMNDDGSKVDYSSMKNSDSFKEYVKDTETLQNIDISDLSDNQRKAFFINIYNALILHAIAENNYKENFLGVTLNRLILYATASYNVGGFIYSLNDIENGILRNNQVSAVPFTKKPFSIKNNDPRIIHCVECDPRIHFALNCGAISCPPIAFYDGTEINEQLDDATIGFINTGGVETGVGNGGNVKTVSLSKLFKWYKTDFEQKIYCKKDDYSVLIKWINKYAEDKLKDDLNNLPENSIEITFQEYDFGLND